MVEVPRWGTVIVSALLMISPVLRTGARQTGCSVVGRDRGFRARDRSSPEPCYAFRRFIFRRGASPRPPDLAAVELVGVVARRLAAPWQGSARGDRTARRSARPRSPHRVTARLRRGHRRVWTSDVSNAA